MKAYLNPTVLRKDITRFAPLWSLYSVFALLYLLLVWDVESTAARFANTVQYAMMAMGVVNLFYALIAALLLFGDLFKARMCNMLHTFPVRREGWFLTHLVSGILFCIVPNTVVCLAGAAFLGQYCYLAFLWLGLTVLQYLFFFGVAVFGVMCAGNGLGATAIYAIIHFLAVLVAWLVKVLYEPLLYGIRIDTQKLARLSPVVLFSDSLFVQTHYDNMTSETVLDGFQTEAWIYLYAAVAAGVVLMALALLIYRRRALERAGDFISLRPVAPVFLMIYTLCVGAVLYFVAEATSGSLRYLFLVLGFAIGFFTGRMLLERKVQVFRWKNLLAFGVFIGVFAATAGLTVLDPVGITRYVPEAERVQSVTLSPYSSIYSITRQSCRLTAPEDVETVIEMHRDALAHRSRNDGEAVVPVNLRYTLENGNTVERSYYLPEEEYKPLLQLFYSRPICVMGTEDIDELLEGLCTLEYYDYEGLSPYVYMSNQSEDLPYLDEKFGGEVDPVIISVTGSFAEQPVARGLLEAVYADCLEGTMSQWYNDGAAVGNLNMQLEIDGVRQHWDITLYRNNRNTLWYLFSLVTP